MVVLVGGSLEEGDHVVDADAAALSGHGLKQDLAPAIRQHPRLGGLPVIQQIEHTGRRVLLIAAHSVIGGGVCMFKGRREGEGEGEGWYAFRPNAGHGETKQHRLACLVPAITSSRADVGAGGLACADVL